MLSIPSACYPLPTVPELHPPPLPCQHILIIEAASPAGRVSILPEGVRELLVEGVSKASRDALPGQDQDDNHGVLTMVACPMPHQAQQLLLQGVSSDHLRRHGMSYDPAALSSSARCTPLATATDLELWGFRTVPLGKKKQNFKTAK